MKKNTPKNLSPKGEKMTYDCGGKRVLECSEMQKFLADLREKP